MNEYVAALDVCITQEHLPMTVKAFCKVCKGERCIILNQDLSDEKKYEAVAHELLHFSRNDLCSDEDVENLESTTKIAL